MAKTAAKPRQKKPKQGFLPDMEPPSIREIDDAADALAETRSDRMKLTEIEITLAADLLGLMHKHRLTTYQTAEGKTVTVDVNEKVRVRKTKAEGNGEASDGD